MLMQYERRNHFEVTCVHVLLKKMLLNNIIIVRCNIIALIVIFLKKSGSHVTLQNENSILLNSLKNKNKFIQVLVEN
jgi:hypothetical protein